MNGDCERVEWLVLPIVHLCVYVKYKSSNQYESLHSFPSKPALIGGIVPWDGASLGGCYMFVINCPLVALGSNLCSFFLVGQGWEKKHRALYTQNALGSMWAV